jgi:mannose-6-phosphate isomerase-like protein (cupin superfamily)
VSTHEASPLAFVLGPDEGRGSPLNIVGEPTLVKVGAQDSRGAIALFHLTAPPMSGPPLHVHSREDETFYVLEGELVFEFGGRREVVGPGGMVYLERGVPHRYQNFTDRDARLLIGVAPGGFQDFFVELSAATPAGGGMPPMDVLQSIDTRYGIRTLGPPLMD